MNEKGWVDERWLIWKEGFQINLFRDRIVCSCIFFILRSRALDIAGWGQDWGLCSDISQPRARLWNFSNRNKRKRYFHLYGDEHIISITLFRRASSFQQPFCLSLSGFQTLVHIISYKYRTRYTSCVWGGRNVSAWPHPPTSASIFPFSPLQTFCLVFLFPPHLRDDLISLTHTDRQFIVEAWSTSD